jgi:hypothetical protein
MLYTWSVIAELVIITTSDIVDAIYTKKNEDKKFNDKTIRQFVQKVILTFKSLICQSQVTWHFVLRRSLGKYFTNVIAGGPRYSQ